MNNTSLNPEIEKIKSDSIFNLLNSKEEIRDWFYVYFDIWFPCGHVYPTSNSSPIEAAWRIYELMKTGKSKDIPQVAMHSSRDSFKTLLAAAIEVLCMVHFRICIANASSQLGQAEKTVEYINSFFRKIKPYLENNGWKKNSDNKRKIEWVTDRDEIVYIQVLTMTIRGMNSSHLPMLFLDEADLIQDVRALHESKMIPSTYKSYYPLTCVLSTLKFSGGIMQKLLKETQESGGEIYKWNILDVTERITPEEAKVNEPKITRYVSSDLPMSNLSVDEYEKLTEKEKAKYERFEAYAGIAEHPMLPVMRNYLVDRPQSDYKFLYKPLAAVHNNFKVTPPDMATAQLLCNQPSSTNLIFSRFEPTLNTLTLPAAWKKAVGSENPAATHNQLRDFLKSMGAEFIGGADWGFTDFTSLVVLAQMPGGETWLVDSFLGDKLDPVEQVKFLQELSEKWGVSNWYVDQANPGTIKMIKEKGIRVPAFTKDVEIGITALKTRIVDANGTRRFFILDIPENKLVIDMFGQYKWALDGKGDIIEGKPHHDRDGWSDIADSIRYPMQNLFGKSGKVMFATATGTEHKKDPAKMSVGEIVAEVRDKQTTEMMKKLVPGYNPENNDPNKKKRRRILF